MIHSRTLSLIGLAVLLLASACGGDTGGDAAPVNACGNVCPDAECFAGTCVGNNPNNDADTGDDVGDAGDVADTDDTGPEVCEADTDCPDAQYCDTAADPAACVDGCRAGGCGPDATCDTETRACVDDPAGDCVEDRDCPRGDICVLDGEGLGSCVEGCREDDDCNGGLTCHVETNQCVAGPCEGAEDCPDGEYCDAEAGFCRPGCVDDDDCGALSCTDGACIGEACGDDAPCPSGQYCDADSGACRLGCGAHTDCDEGSYCDDAATTCFEGCRDDAECGDGQSCRLLGVADGLRQRCVPTPCGEDTDCERGFFCELGEGPDGLCDAGCRLDPDNCAEGLACDAETRGCIAAACESADDCADGQYCDELQLTPTCAVGCDDNDQCRTDACDLAVNLCECERASDCDGDQSCFGDRCVRSCEDDLDCPSPLECDRGARVCRLPCEDDEYEPNNSEEEPVELEPGQYSLAMCNDAVNGFTFNDCFVVPLRFEEVVFATIDFEHQDGDLDLRLYDEGLSLVDLSQSQTDGEQIVHSAQDNGNYVLCIEPQGGAFSTIYTLDLEVQDVVLECFEDGNEALGDNNCSDARDRLEPLPLEQEVRIDGRTVCEGDEDWVALRMRLGQILNASVTRTEGAATLDVELLLNDCSTIVAQTDTFGPIRTLQYTSDSDGIFYLRTFAEEPLLTAGYDLSILLEPGDFQCPEDVVNGVPSEPNESSNEATFLDIEREEEFAHEDLYVCADDVDWYSVRIDVPSDRIRATLRQSLDDEPLSIAVIDVDGGTVLNQNIDLLAEKTVESLSLPEAGIYYIRVAGIGDIPSNGVNYDLELTVFPDESCVEDGFEPDDALEDANGVGHGEYFATMCRDDFEELDYYRMELSAGDQVEITLEYDHGRISPLDALPAVLYGPGGLDDFQDFTIRDGLTDFDVMTGGSFRVTPDGAGDWYLAVGAGGAGRFVEYTLNVEILAAECEEPDDVFEPNEDCAMAHELTLGDQVSGFVCGLTGDVDWFSVDVEAGERLEIHMDYFHFDGDLDVEVYEADSNTYVGGSFNNGPNFEDVVVEETFDGTYCIRVYTGNSLTQNDYSLSASVAD
jgi:hypothetical protein